MEGTPRPRDHEGKLAHGVIRRHFKSLYRVVTRGDISADLYAKGILDENTFETVTGKSLTDKEAGQQIVRAVQKAVLINVEVFETFCAALEDDLIAKETVQKLRDDYKDELQKAVDSDVGPSQELTQLKLELEVFKIKLSRGNAPQESCLEMMRTSISQYVETALKADETAETLKQQMTLLCNKDFLIPPPLHDWVLEEVEKSSSVLISETPLAPPKVPKPEAPDEPLFCKEVLYHASLCCNAICTSTCTSQKLTDFLGPKNQMIYHHLDQASMSISTTVQDMAPYLIAVEKNTIYVAFRGEINLLDWSKKYASLEDGLKKQAKCIPLRFFVEQLWDKKRIVLAGFSFGGLLAAYITSRIWSTSYIRKDVLGKRVICITFGQPVITVPCIRQVAENCPEFESSIHSIFSTEDVIPHLMRLVACADSLPSASVKPVKSSTPPLVSKLPTPPMVGSQTDTQGTATEYFRSLSNLQESQNGTHYAAAVRSASASRISEALDCVKSALKNVSPAKAKDLVGKYYEISTEEEHGPRWNTLSKQKASQELGGLTPSRIEALEADIFQHHTMEIYKNNMYRSYLDQEPDKYSPPKQLREVVSVSFLKPSLTAVELHEYPNEHALVLEGDNLWFCHQIKLGEGDHPCCIDTPAQHISRRSIQFNYTPSDKCEIVVDKDRKIKVAVHSHFANPIRRKVDINEEPYKFSQRQMQLAKHTPSEVIEMAYWSAVLECNSSCGRLHGVTSKRFTAVTQFLEEAVQVVPIESIFHAIAQCDSNTSVECSKAAVQSISQAKLPSSRMMTDLSLLAMRRIVTGLPPSVLEVVDQVMEVFVQQMKEEAAQASLQRTYSQATRGDDGEEAPDDSSSTFDITSFFQALTIRAAIEMFPDHVMPVEVDPSTHDSILKLLQRIFSQGLSKIRNNVTLDAVCGLSIERVYPNFVARRTFLNPSPLQSPIKVLKEAKAKLALFAEEAQQDIGSTPREDSEGMEMSKVDEMLELVRGIRENHLNICASLLGAFMELQIRIPLLNNPAATAKLLSSKAAPVAMGVWALFSMSYSELRQMLQCTEDNELYIEIADYIRGILSDSNEPSQSRDSMYAGKLQFLLQGMQTTTCCSSQYISYSLEHQLCKSLKFNPSMSVKEITEKWDTIFVRDALSLVAKPYRSLIARWLKWALLIHNLRESLAEYTCVGVIGLVNSGKSQLVRTLFRVQALVGTTGKTRTTVPFLYNLDGVVDGLDVIDFPGVDDQDHCIPELAQLLLGLAQIVIFVVNYRKVSTDLAKEWLHQLQAEDIPLLVCLSHADRLYAECMGKEDKDPKPTEFKRQFIGREHQRIMEELGHHPSRTVEMCCFRQEPDSTLKPEYLREVGIKSPQDVGDWLVKTFRNKFDQIKLAENLNHFIHSPKDMSF